MRAEVTHGHAARKGDEEGDTAFLAWLPRDSPSISRGHYYSFHLAGEEIILLRSDNRSFALTTRLPLFFPHLRLASDYD